MKEKMNPTQAFKCRFQESRVIDQAEICLKTFERYLRFLNDEAYINLEDIKCEMETFVKEYETLYYDLDPDTPKKLGRIFRLTKTVYNLILSTDKDLTRRNININEERIECIIDTIKEKIAEVKEKGYISFEKINRELSSFIKGKLPN